MALILPILIIEDQPGGEDHDRIISFFSSSFFVSCRPKESPKGVPRFKRPRVRPKNFGAKKRERVRVENNVSKNA